MFVTQLVGRRFGSRYAVPSVLLSGMACAALDGQLHLGGVQWGLTLPVFAMHEFRWRAMVSLAMPLFVVTMAPQNLPGVAAIRAGAHDMPISKIITPTGIATLLLPPFGAFALSRSAITAATCRAARPTPTSTSAAWPPCRAARSTV